MNSLSPFPLRPFLSFIFCQTFFPFPPLQTLPKLICLFVRKSFWCRGQKRERRGGRSLIAMVVFFFPPWKSFSLLETALILVVQSKSFGGKLGCCTYYRLNRFHYPPPQNKIFFFVDTWGWFVEKKACALDSFKCRTFVFPIKYLHCSQIDWGLIIYKNSL